MKNHLHRFLFVGLFAACTSLAVAQTSFVPSAMSYQGLLTDDQGTAVAPNTPENRNVEFRIYSVAAGGSPLWGEAQTVTVFKGNFSVILGNGTAINGAASGPASFAAVFTNATSADLYFGITPQGGAEFAPRQKLLSSAFALRAKTAETVNATAQAAGVPSQFNWLSANNLTIGGHTKIAGSNVLEFGFGVANKEGSAGQIGYNVFNTNALSIVGAGENGASRKIKLWAEGGTEFNGPISFPNRYEQSISFNDASNGIGSQNEGIYLRAFNRISFFANGKHDSGSAAPGVGGTLLGSLNPSGFTLNSGKFTGDGSGLTNVPIPSTVNSLTLNGTINKNGHGTFIGSFGEGHTFGSQDFTTYSRSARNFAWYLGGAHNANELNAGGGTRMMTLTSGGLEMNLGGLSVPNASLSFGSRLGQQINLYSNTFGMGVQPSTTYLRTAGAFNLYVGGTHSDTQNDAGGGVQTASWDSSRFDFYRRVYIGGDTNAGQAPLEIAGASTNQGLGTIAEFWNPGNGGAGYNGRTNFSTRISIRASNTVVASNFVATSDLRLKLPEGRSDTAKDLVTLNALEITNYTMKDKTVDGGRKNKKLIAQQVENVYPQAVSQTRGNLPDIYRVATAKNGLIAFNEAGDANLKKGETIRLVQGGSDIIAEVTEVKAEGFMVKETVKDGELFVYGHRVDDLRMVDYEAISMLNVSATQELTRQLQAQGAALEEIRKERDALAKEVVALRASTSLQDQRLARMEAALETVAKNSSAPIALQVKLDR